MRPRRAFDGMAASTSFFGLAWQLSQSTILGLLSSRRCEEEQAGQARGERTVMRGLGMQECYIMDVWCSSQ
jgi:hypothetical protein